MSIDEQIGRIVLALEEERKQQEEERRMERRNLIKENLQKGYAAEMLADIMRVPLSLVLEIQREL